jgi:predicted nucleic acid-binding protein
MPYMNGSVFVDTNILVYRRDSGYPAKQASAERWLRDLWNNRNGRVSVQVLNEYYVTVTQKLSPGLSREAAWLDIDALFRWSPRPVDRAVMEFATHQQSRFSLPWWDALIVSAAVLSGCRYLLSEDFQPAMQFGELEVINPFERDTAS